MTVKVSNGKEEKEEKVSNGKEKEKKKKVSNGEKTTKRSLTGAYFRNDLAGPSQLLYNTTGEYSSHHDSKTVSNQRPVSKKVMVESGKRTLGL